jgi:hypothetical protein
LWWAFVLVWLRGILVHSLVLGVALLALGWLGPRTHTWALVGVLVAFAAAVWALRLPLARLMANLQPALAETDWAALRLRTLNLPHPRLKACTHTDAAFTGAPLAGQLLLPESAFRNLPTDDALLPLLANWSAVHARKLPLADVLLALLWLAGSASLATLLPLHETVTLSGIAAWLLATQALCWVGVAVFAPLARLSVLQRDASRKKLFPNTRFEAYWQECPTWGGGLCSVPTAGVRQRSFQQKPTHVPEKAWVFMPARTLALLTWPLLGGASRACFYNQGRPELWVLPPVA